MAASIGIACAAGAAAAEPPPIGVFHGLPRDMLFAVSFEGRDGVAVGDFGLVVETADGGRSWARQPEPPTSLGLLAVTRKAGRCIAAGQQGLIMTAEDCRRWRVSPPVTDARILAVGVNARGVAYAVGAFGTVLKSLDGGLSWQALKPDWAALSSGGNEPHLYDVHVGHDAEVTVVGEFETVMRSNDGGASWALLHRGARSLFGLKVLGNGDAYAVGQEGVILKGTRRGAQWAQVESGTRSILTGIWAAPDGRAVASGIYTILHSADGGRSWRMDPSRSARTGSHHAVAAAGEGEAELNVLVVGAGAAILSIRR